MAGFLVFFKRQTGLALNDDGDWVRLISPDGITVDAVHYDNRPPYDCSYSRTTDGLGHWTADCPVSIGGPNCQGAEWHSCFLPGLMK